MLNTQSSINKPWKLLLVHALISAMFPNAATGKPDRFNPKREMTKAQVFSAGRAVSTLGYTVKPIKSRGTHSWVSLGSWKAFTGIWLMRFRLSLRTCRVEPKWSRAPSSSTLILLLLRYLHTGKVRFVSKLILHKDISLT